MAVRSVVQIDVDDGRFKQFVAIYEKYEKALAAAPGKWAQVNQQITQGGKHLDTLAAAVLAQTDVLATLLTQHKTVTYEVEKQGRAWQGVAKWAKGVAGDIEGATKFLLRWSPLVGGLLGIGGLYGLDRLAGNVSAGRQSALGLGLSYGEQRAFSANFQRLVDPDSFLSGVANAKLDVRQRVGLLGAGLTEGDLAGNTAQTAVALLGRLKQIADTTNPALYGNVIEARHLGNFVSPQDLQRLRDTKPGELNQLFAGYQQDKGRFDIGETSKAWQDLTTQLTRSGQALENAFVKGLAPFADVLPKISAGLEHLVTSFLSQPELKTWVADVASGFERLADFFAGKKSIKDVVSPAVTGAVVGGAAGMLVGMPWVGAAVGAGVGKAVGWLTGSSSEPASSKDQIQSQVPGRFGTKDPRVVPLPPPNLRKYLSGEADTFEQRTKGLYPNDAGALRNHEEALKRHGELLLDNTRATRDNTGATRKETAGATVGSSTEQIVNAAH